MRISVGIMRQATWSLVAGVFVLITTSCLFLLELWILLDLRSFEYAYLIDLIGARGGAIILLVHLPIVAVTYWAFFAIFGRPPPKKTRLTRISLILLPSLAFLWMLDWVILEHPVTAELPLLNRDHSHIAETQDTILQYAVDRADITALLGPTEPAILSEKSDLATMFARVAINHPHLYENLSMGTVIARTASQHNVDAALLFAWAYLDSFYGEAASGPIPFFHSMTGETFRDLVQVHLPYWFIESSVRAKLIETDWLEHFAGPSVGAKLRYAIHKATYDVSVDPYDTNIFSDVYLVLQKYPQEFQLLFQSTEEIDIALRNAFNKLQENALMTDCHRPYDLPIRDARYYEANRFSIVTFARAIYYKLLFDFEFATKVQALVARYYQDFFEQTLSTQTWQRISEGQRTALVAILRDVYVPNIGRPSGNLYVLPELNCTPVVFVSQEASVVDWSTQDNIWRPEEHQRLWAGATYKLRNLAEVWQSIKGQELRIDEPPTDTISDSEVVVRRNLHRLQLRE